MPKEMLINVSAGEECRIAVVENGKLEELYMERASSVSHVGNVYKGKVTNVEASIQAAFIDFGIGRNGFLHISDLMPTYFGKKGENIKESVGRKMARRDRPPIQQCLRRGDEIIVQVIKEGLGTKGPTLSSYLSIPGRILVMMPGVGKSGVSKKIEDEEERRRLRDILDGLKPPKDAGFIIRTAGVGKTKAEIERDFKYLMRLWENIQKADKKKAPLELYAEGDLVMRTVRDVYTTDIERIVVDDKTTAKRIKDFFKLLMPRTKNKVEVYDENTPLFHHYKIEKDIEMMHARTVPLPSGGSLVIDQTEAIVAIDVNSGKSRQAGDAETTAFKTDLEAADEIPRQLKLRDLGGVVICDFIDLRFERHRRELEARLAENLKKDRAKTRFLRMSEFGIVEMTRQRMRPSLEKSVYHDCQHCAGHGLVKTPESMGLDVLRRLTIAAHNERVKRVELTLHPDVASVVLNRKRQEIASLEEESEKRILIKLDDGLALDQMKFELFDDREGAIWLEVLGMTPPQQGGGRDQRGQDRGRNDRRDQRGRDRHQQAHRDDRHERGDHRDEFESDHDEETSSPLPQREPDTVPAGVVGEERRDRRGRRDGREGGRDGGRNAGRNDRRPVQPRDDEHVADDQAEFEAGEDHDADHQDHAREEHADNRSDADTDRGYDDHRGDTRNGRDDRQDDRAHGQHSGQYNDGGQYGEGGGRRRRRRRRGRRGRGGDGQNYDNNGQGGQSREHDSRRPDVYSNDPGVEEFADDVGDAQPRDDRQGGRRHDGRDDRGQRHHQQRGGQRGNDRGNNRGNFRDDRGNRGGPQQHQPQRSPNPSNVRGPQVVSQSDDVDEDDDGPLPGNSIHGEPTHLKTSTSAGKGGKGGRRGRRGRGKSSKDITEERLPVVTSDSLVARFLDEPVAPPVHDDEDEDAVGNRVTESAGTEKDAADGESGGKRRRRRGGRGRGKGRGATGDQPQARKASAAPLPAVPRTGSTDAHAVDDVEDKLPDVSRFLSSPTSAADLDYLPEYEDDE